MKRCGAFPHYERTTSASPTHPSEPRSGTSRPLPDATACQGRLHRVTWLFVSRNVRDLQSCCGLKSLNIRCVQTLTAARTRLSGELNALIVPGHPDALWQQRPSVWEAGVTGGLLGFSSRERPVESLRVPCPAQATGALPLSTPGILSCVTSRLNFSYGERRSAGPPNK